MTIQNLLTLAMRCVAAISLAAALALIVLFVWYVGLFSWPEGQYLWIALYLASSSWCSWRILRWLLPEKIVGRRWAIGICSVPVGLWTLLLAGAFARDLDVIRAEIAEAKSDRKREAATESLDRESLDQEALRQQISALGSEVLSPQAVPSGDIAPAAPVCIWDLDRNKLHSLDSRVPSHRRAHKNDELMILVLIRISQREVVGSIHVGSRGKGHALIRPHAEVFYVNWPEKTLIRKATVMGEKPDNTFAFWPQTEGDIQTPLWGQISTALPGMTK